MTVCRKERRGSTRRRGVRSLEANQVLQPEEYHQTVRHEQQLPAASMHACIWHRTQRHMLSSKPQWHKLDASPTGVLWGVTLCALGLTKPCIPIEVPRSLRVLKHDCVSNYQQNNSAVPKVCISSKLFTVGNCRHKY